MPPRTLGTQGFDHDEGDRRAERRTRERPNRVRRRISRRPLIDERRRGRQRGDGEQHARPTRAPDGPAKAGHDVYSGDTRRSVRL